MATLELRNIVKHYRAAEELVRAVDGVCLSVGAGEMVAVCGPSGSGKTTLLMIAARLLRPDDGNVVVQGRDLAEMSTQDAALYLRRDVGMIGQAFQLRGGSALDNACVKLLADGHSLREARRIVRPWMERVGLGKRAEHSPKQLSMGERQRVAIARALANEPRLVLADEPTGNLDSTRSGEILGLLRELCHERQVAVLLVTHDAQALRYVDRVHTLKDGHLHDGVADGLLSAA